MAYMAVVEKLVTGVGVGVAGFVLRELPLLLNGDTSQLMARVETTCHVADALGRMAGLDYLLKRTKVASEASA